MNKPQWVVFWIAVVTITLICFLAPEYVVFKGSRLAPEHDPYILPQVDWGFIMRFSIPVLLIGGGLILALHKRRG